MLVKYIVQCLTWGFHEHLTEHVRSCAKYQIREVARETIVTLATVDSRAGITVGGVDARSPLGAAEVGTGSGEEAPEGLDSGGRGV